jgi:hypothetical protein
MSVGVKFRICGIFEEEVNTVRKVQEALGYAVAFLC